MPPKSARKGKVKIKFVEERRRQQQSARDKRPPTKSRPKAAKPKPTRRNPPGNSGVIDYARLIANPCEGKLAHAVMPSSAGSFVMRIPFRRSITLPSTSVNVYGGSYAAGVNGTNCKTMYFGIFPNNYIIGPQATVFGAYAHNNGSGYSPTNVAWAPELSDQWDPQGLQTLKNLAGKVRPIAGCIKVRYAGAAGNSAGTMVAYEGPAKNLFGRFGKWESDPANPNATQMQPFSSFDNFYLAGKATNSGVNEAEARLNYARVDEYWTEFRDFSTEGVYPKAADPTTMPMACVVIQDAIPGSTYNVEGALVYEWIPTLGDGIQLPSPPVITPGALEKTSNLLRKSGDMLVSFASTLNTSNWVDRAVKGAGQLALKGALKAAPLLLTL